MATLAIGIVLARILGPKPFGIVAVATLLIGFGNLLADSGFGSALVQRDELTDDDIRFAFFFQLAAGVVLGAAAYLGAGQFARLFHNPEIAPVIRILAWMFPLQSFGQTAAALLKRRLEFKAVQLAQVTGHVSYLAVAIVLALRGFGVWSLVAAQLTQVTLGSLLLYGQVRHSLAMSVRPSPWMLGFSFKVLVSSSANWGICNLDNAVVGNIFGVESLGLYSRAFQIVNTPVNAVISGLQGVLLSAYSRVQTQPEVLRRVFLASLSIISVLILPPFAAVAAVPGTVIVALYGRVWSGAVPLLAPLSLAMSLLVLLNLAAPLLWAVGRVSRELGVVMATVGLAVCVYYGTAQISLPALAWGVLAVYLFRFAGMMREMRMFLEVPWSEIVVAIRGGFLLAVTSALVAFALNVLLEQSGVSVLLALAVELAAAMAVPLLALRFIPRLVLARHADYVVHQIRSAVPASMSFLVPAEETSQWK